MSEAETTSSERGLARFRAFPKPFWVINGIELFERGAYYTLNAVFYVFMVATFTGSGMDAASANGLAGLLGATLFALLYLVPVLGAPFTEKYGYQASLGVVFLLLAAGYVIALFATGVPLVIAAIVCIGLGAGIFKPMPAAVVSQTSTPKDRNFAFAIYYAAINIGALVFPLLVGMVHLLIVRGGGNPFQEVALTTTENQLLFQMAFGTAAVLSGINLLLSFTLFRNLRAPQRDVNVLQSVATLKEVGKYPSFLVLMVIYAGFWFMYAMGIALISQYMVDAQRMPAWFTISLLATINPAVIIGVTPLIGRFTERFNSLPLMIVGILVYAGGLALIGFSNTALFFVLGVVIFSVGELITHPSYLSYVSKIAPAGKETVFLGYGFLPIGVGLFIGLSVGGAVYGTVGVEQGRPELFWSIVAAVGIVTSAALIIYNAMLTRLREPKETRASRGFPLAPIAAAVIVLLMAPAVIGAGTVVPGTPLVLAGDGDDLSAASLVTLALAPMTGTTAEEATTTQELTLPANATGNATLVLVWTDEAATGPGQSNAPDTFQLRVTSADGTVLAESDPTANAAGGEGRISLPFPAAPGTYTVDIVNVASGDVTAGAGSIAAPMGLGGAADDGNAWTLEIAHQAEAGATA